MQQTEDLIMPVENEESTWSRAWEATKGAAVSVFNFAKYVKNGDDGEKTKAERDRDAWTANSALMAFGTFTCAMFLLGGPLTIAGLATMCAIKLGKKIYDYNKQNDINLPSQKLQAAYEIGKQFYGDNMPKLEDVLKLTKDENGNDLTQEQFNERLKGQVEEFKKTDYGKALLSDIRVQQMFKNAFNIDLEKEFNVEKVEEKAEEKIVNNINNDFDTIDEINKDSIPLDAPSNHKINEDIFQEENKNKIIQNDLEEENNINNINNENSILENSSDNNINENIIKNNLEDNNIIKERDSDSEINEFSLDDFIKEDKKDNVAKEEPKVEAPKKETKSNRFVQFFKNHNPFSKSSKKKEAEIEPLFIESVIEPSDSLNDLDINMPRESVNMKELDEYPISDPKNTLEQIGGSEIKDPQLNKNNILDQELGSLQPANK